jgi:hypothetical protein
MKDRFLIRLLFGFVSNALKLKRQVNGKEVKHFQAKRAKVKRWVTARAGQICGKIAASNRIKQKKNLSKIL